MPLTGDVQREMSILFQDAEGCGKSFVDLTAELLLQLIEQPIRSELESDPGRLAVCRSVMLTSIDLALGDRVLVDHAGELVIRFVLPRRTSLQTQI